MKKKATDIRKILFITLSNIGDAILTLPALDALRKNFPNAQITVMAGPRPAELFEDNPYVARFIAYDKYAPFSQKLRLVSLLQKENFDIVVDLRNSIFGFLLKAPYKTSVFQRVSPAVTHMRDRHLLTLGPIENALHSEGLELLHKSLPSYQTDWEYLDTLFAAGGIRGDDTIVAVAAGARSAPKRWPREKFARLIDALVKEYPVKVVLIGDQDDTSVNYDISRMCKVPVVDLAAKTSLVQVADLFKRTALLITNDSANLHLASYVGIPVVAVFGPTDDEKYGPWSKDSLIVTRQVPCRPCMQAQCRFGTLECLERVDVGDVLLAVRQVLSKKPRRGTSARQQKVFKRILIVRTDKIGDVILSTPVIKAMRDAYPNAYIAMVVRPYTKEIVEKNPYLDEVILYDKDRKHKSWLATALFCFRLRQKKFDLAIVLNPSVRSNLIPWLARIPRRIGYDRKWGFLLTDRIPDKKYEGIKHEIDYNLDLIRVLGIDPLDKDTLMPLDPAAEDWAEEILKQQGVSSSDVVVVINAGASDPSKVWPSERYAQLADRLAAEGYKIIILGGPKDTETARQITIRMKSPFISMVGNNTISQAASLLRRVSLFISTDTGPMHLASSVNTPIIALFGRKRQGLGPTRWGPHNRNHIVIQKDIGCHECAPQNCAYGFKCLEAISVEDVSVAAQELLRERKKTD